MHLQTAHHYSGHRKTGDIPVSSLTSLAYELCRILDTRLCTISHYFLSALILFATCLAEYVWLNSLDRCLAKSVAEFFTGPRLLSFLNSACFPMHCTISSSSILESSSRQ